MGGSVGVLPANNLVNAHVNLLDMMNAPVHVQMAESERHGSTKVNKLSRGG